MHVDTQIKTVLPSDQGPLEETKDRMVVSESNFKQKIEMNLPCLLNHLMGTHYLWIRVRLSRHIFRQKNDIQFVE